MEHNYNADVNIPDINEASTGKACKLNFFFYDFLELTVNKLTAINWWTWLCKSTVSSTEAIKFLSLPITSAACEKALKKQF